MNKLEVYGIALVALVLTIVGAFFTGRYVEWDKIRIEQKAQDAEHKQELKDASDKHAQEIRDILAAKPLPPIRLCKPIQVGQAPSTDTSTPTGDLPTVPSGGSPVRPEQPSGSAEQQAGPDISDLLGLLALHADEVTADLRECQSVK